MKKSILSLILLFLGFSSVKAQQNILQENGNVGIGTINPTEKLVVRGKVSIDSMLVVKDSILVNKDIRVKKNFKVEKDVRFTAIDTATNLNNKSILLIQPNGKLVKVSQDELAQSFGDLFYEPKGCTDIYKANPTWMNGSKKIYTKCPDVLVGINNNAPRVNLDVEGAIYGQKLRIGNQNPAELSADLIAGTAYNGNNNENILNFTAYNKNSLFKLTNDGNVTIGNVENTDVKLKIDVDVFEGLYGKKALVTNFNGSDYAYANMFNVNKDLTKAVTIFNTTSGKENIVLYGDGTADTRKVNINSGFPSVNDITLFLIQNSENKVFQVANNGNVKIGSTNPTSAKLSVDLNAAETNLHAFESNYTAAFDYSFANVFKVDRDLTKALAVINTATNKENIVLYGDGTANVRRVNISTELNNDADAVLFLIQNAEDKLIQVNNQGVLRARRIIVNQEAWADFVFDKEYKLMPLKELETYIDKNKHLPNVPSEKEVMVNGTDVAEMNKILLQKVEELTLYLLEQNKLVIELQKNIIELNENK